VSDRRLSAASVPILVDDISCTTGDALLKFERVAGTDGLTFALRHQEVGLCLAETSSGAALEMLTCGGGQDLYFDAAPGVAALASDSSEVFHLLQVVDASGSATRCLKWAGAALNLDASCDLTDSAFQFIVFGDSAVPVYECSLGMACYVKVIGQGLADGNKVTIVDSGASCDVGSLTSASGLSRRLLASSTRGRPAR
jgi:hypothetical protein